METKRIEGADFSSTGYSCNLSLIAGKYKPIILYCLMEYESVRFNQMQHCLGRVADKTLSLHLKAFSAFTSSRTSSEYAFSQTRLSYQGS